MVRITIEIEGIQELEGEEFTTTVGGVTLNVKEVGKTNSAEKMVSVMVLDSLKEILQGFMKGKRKKPMGGAPGLFDVPLTGNN